MKPHLKLDKLNIIHDAVNIWNTIDHSTENNEDIKFYRQASRTMGHYSLGKITKRWTYFRTHFAQLTEEPCLIEFYVGDKINYNNKPHTDRGRTVAINIPIKVDLENSTAFFGKHFDIAEYPEADLQKKYTFDLSTKETKFKAETNTRYLGQYNEDFYDTVDLDCPVLFDPCVPHGGWNRAQDKRVLMSLSFDSMSYKQAYNKCVELGWTSEIS